MNPSMFILTTALLSVPLFNLLIGSVVGLMTLVTMLQARRFNRLIRAAGIAAAWVVASFLQMGAIGGEVPGGGILWTIPVAGLAWTFLKYINATGRKGLDEQIALANAIGKGTFSLELGFGAPDVGVVVLIDSKTRHFAFLTETTHRVEPLEFLKSWNIAWTETSHSGPPLLPGYTSKSKVRLQLNTRDFERPVMYALMANKASADHWSERLDNLVNYGTQSPTAHASSA